jgi:hypothetical protein
MNILDEILSILTLATQAAQSIGGSIPPIEAGATIALALEQIAAKAIAAYEAQTGTPLDLTKLHAEAPVAASAEPVATSTTSSTTTVTTVKETTGTGN